MDLKPVIRPIICGAIRHGMTVLAGALAAHGYLAASKEEAFITATCSVGLLAGGVLWSAAQKFLARADVAAAMATPVAGTYSLDDALAVVMPLVTQAISAAMPQPVSPAAAAPAGTPYVAPPATPFQPPIMGGQ